MKIAALATLATLVAITGLSACGRGSNEAARIETMISDYYTAIGAYDYAKMRSMYGSGWEIFDDGLRLDADGFEALVKRLEGNQMTWQFAIEGADTEINGDRAYTNYVITNSTGEPSRWYGTAYARRTGEVWRFGHMVMMSAREAEEVPSVTDTAATP